MNDDGFENSDHEFARTQHQQMIRSLFAGQDRKQAAAIRDHETQELEKRERVEAQQMPQPKPQAIAPRFHEIFHSKPKHVGPDGGDPCVH